ncbi:MAG: 4-demethylwyosine synthase TYW1 [Candidatus Aenigmatarchaeota archaeon]
MDISAFTKRHYKVWEHVAVKLCHWCRLSLKNKGFCYKQKFYGIESHRCLQLSPAFLWCTNNCIKCWRPREWEMVMPSKWAEPEQILQFCLDAQRRLLSGFKGYTGTDRKKWTEAQRPCHAAISLIGEPTLYPAISELIGFLKQKGFTTYLVTNGMLPERLEGMTEPTQLYLSLDATNEKMHRELNRPKFTDAWQRMEKSLSLLPCFKNTVLRITAISGYNMQDAGGFANIVNKYNPSKVEVKAYMHLGHSRKILPADAMPGHEHVKAFARAIAEKSGYSIIDEQRASRVVLLG